MSEPKVAQYIIGMGGDASDLDAVFAGVKKSARSTVDEIKALTGKVDLFSAITDNLPKVQQALDSAKSKVAQFTAEIAKIEATGTKAPKALTDALAAAERQVSSATKELARQQQQLATLDSQLARAGVNTANLAAEQARLAVASKAAADAAALQAAKQSLGVVTLKDTEGQALKLRASFDALKASGTLSANEIGAAQVALNTKLKELDATVTRTGASFQALKGGAIEGIGALALKLTAAVAIIGGFVSSLSSVTDAAREYRQALAEASTGTDITKDRIAALGSQAQTLAQQIGVGPIDAVKALFALLRAGVPEGNVVEVLRTSAEAAKASLSDLPTGVRVAKLLLNDFKVPIDQLGNAFDTLKATIGSSKEGFEAFANSGGQLLAVAKSSGVGLDQLGAVLRVMTKNGLDAEESIAALTKIIVQLANPDTRQKLLAIGITSTDLTEIFRKLGEKTVTLNSVLDLTGVSVKAAGAVATIINSSDQLIPALDRARNSAGAVQSAVEKMYNSPKEISERFHATLEVTKQKLGEQAGATGGLTTATTGLLAAFNAYLESARPSVDEANARSAATAKEILSLLGLGKAAKETTTPVREFNDELVRQTAASGDSAKAIKEATDNLALYSTALTANIAVLQKATTDQIAAVKERSTVEIELLNKSDEKRVESAKKAFAIQLQANTDILNLIKAGQAEVEKAVAASIDARIALGRKNKDAESDIQRDITKIQLEANQKNLENYTAFQKELIGQTQTRASAINAIEQARVGFNEKINQAIREAALATAAPLQKYYEQQKEVDRLIAEGREKAATQGIAAGERYFDQAKTLSESLKTEVISDGVVVVSAFQVQQTLVTNLKKIRDAYNKASDEAREKEKAGLDEANGKLETVGKTIADLQKATTELRKQLADEIRIKIADEIKGLAEARRALDDLVKPETKVITVTYKDTRTDRFDPNFIGPPAFNRGGYVAPWRQYAQAFAAGGPVFRAPSWSKVPGVGNGDTIPAAIQSGSFVVRKAAAQKYGDTLMGALTRGYATGGSVGDVSDSKDLIKHAIGYARYILQYLHHPIFNEVKQQVGELINIIERGGAGDNSLGFAKKLINDAQGIAENYHLTEFYGKTSIGGGPTIKDLPTYERWLYNLSLVRNFAGGGSASDTVHAMLTPGEFVFSPTAVKALGVNFLEALNNGRIAAPKPQFFAAGGPVGNVSRSSTDRGAWSSPTYNITINAAGGDLNDPRNVRKIATGLREHLRRTGVDTL